MTKAAAPIVDRETSGAGRPYRHILVISEAEAEADVLRLAIELATRDHARLTVVVPIRRLSPFVYFAGISTPALQAELIDEAERRARRIAAGIPAQVGLSFRCLLPWGASELKQEIARGSYDLCISRSGKWPRRGKVGRLIRAAGKAEVTTLPPPARVSTAALAIDRGD